MTEVRSAVQPDEKRKAIETDGESQSAQDGCSAGSSGSSGSSGSGGGVPWADGVRAFSRLALSLKNNDGQREFALTARERAALTDALGLGQGEQRQQRQQQRQ